MKVVILAGGFGSRISEETDIKPKPMIEIGEKPILWHIMKIYSHYGFNEFIICLGYKGYVIKEYFSNYFLHQTDVTIDFSNNNKVFHQSQTEPWKVTLVDTGQETMTGGRIKRIQKYIGKETFFLTYGDGISNIDIHALLKFHKQKGKIMTLSAVQPIGRFGAIHIEENLVKAFKEKPKGDGFWVNGGFFVCEPHVFDYILEEDNTVFEREPLENLCRDNELASFKHKGFWQPMDTLKDKMDLNKMWNEHKAPWKLWK